MNIAFLSDSVYPYHKGGKETRLHAVATRLATRGHTVTVYTMHWWDGDAPITHEQVRYIPIMPRMPLYVHGVRSIAQGIRFGIASVTFRLRHHDVLDVDHMPQFAILGARLATLGARARFYSTWHEAWSRAYWQEYLGTKGILGWMVDRIAQALGGCIIAVSQRTHDALTHRNRVLIPNGIDTQHAQRISRARKGCDVLYAGRLIAHKHVDVLIDAMTHLPDMMLRIIGEGPEEATLRTRIAQRNLEKHVTILPFRKTHDAVLAEMKAARVYVLPSTREGFGMGVLEANACGTPAVTVRHPDNAAQHLITPGENGELATCTPRSLAAAIRRATTKKRARTCLAHAKAYDWDAVLPRLEEAYAP